MQKSIKLFIVAIVTLTLVVSFAYWQSHQKHKDKVATKWQSRSIASQKLEPEAKPPHHIHHFATKGPAGYTPTQIRHAYQVDQFPGNGTGQKIAIIEAYGSPTIQNDIKTFSTQFKLPPANLQIYYPQGKIKNNNNATWALETSLDVEWAHAIAPGATLLLVVANTATYPDLLSVVDYALGLGATQVSMSWGSVEFSTQTTYDSHFDISKASYFASSGDSGAGVSWPASSPNVVGVGGTTLYLDAAGNPTQPEVAWSGSGGGISVYEQEPSFQSQAQTSGGRGVPDVSFNGDPATGFPVYDSAGYNGHTGWIQVGGTSAGAPQWAALAALANSQRSSNLGAFGAALYSLATPTAESTYFRDITSGCNGSPGPMTCAQNYFDFVTGLGTPYTPSLISGIKAL